MKEDFVKLYIAKQILTQTVQEDMWKKTNSNLNNYFVL